MADVVGTARLSSRRAELGVRDPRPNLPSDDIVYGGLRYPVVTGQACLLPPCTCVGRPDCSNIAFSEHSEFSHPWLVAVGASSYMHISDIIESSSGVQMARITAGGIVAMMKNPQPVWNRSIMNLPRHPMRSAGLSITVCSNGSVPELSSRPLPLPTLINFPSSYTHPETRLNTVSSEVQALLWVPVSEESGVMHDAQPSGAVRSLDTARQRTIRGCLRTALLSVVGVAQRLLPRFGRADARIDWARHNYTVALTFRRGC